MHPYTPYRVTIVVLSLTHAVFVCYGSAQQALMCILVCIQVSKEDIQGTN